MTREPMLSVYRGYGDAGLGEGPGIPITYGEQFLQGTADQLYQREDKLLSTIRPWLTLDSNSEAHGHKQLEAWSCFSAGGRFFVARLVLAGYYDRRVAYFCHARSWPETLLGQACDPGVSLGCSAMFDEPDGERGGSDSEWERLPKLPKDRWVPPVQAERPTAIRFLGHLAQAMAQQEGSYPLLIGVPLREFTPGSPLFSLVAFARAALPAGLKPACSIRMYTSQPENFVLRLNARLIVLPEEMVAAALRVQPKSTLLNRLGECKMGRALAPQYEAYDYEVTDYA